MLLLLLLLLLLFFLLLFSGKLMNCNQMEYGKMDYDEDCNEIAYDDIDYEDIFRKFWTMA